MKRFITDSLPRLRRTLSRAARRLDPRVVRFRDQPRRSRAWIAIPLLAAVLVAGAAAIAATGGEEAASEDAGTPKRETVENSTYAPNRPPTTDGSPGARQSTEEAEPPASRHPNFHDPFYVFIEGEVAKVSAYPLADPPGLVVNLDGAPEPTATPESMVGEDPRVRAIRRRITEKGVRYVLGLTIPVKRIEVLHEGNVVIVTPVK